MELLGGDTGDLKLHAIWIVYRMPGSVWWPIWISIGLPLYKRAIPGYKLPRELRKCFVPMSTVSSSRPLSVRIIDWRKRPLLRGKHVLVEKPLTASVAEAEELVVLAQRQQRVLMVGHTFEYSPAVDELRRLVQNGDLGKIYCVETERLHLGIFRSDVNVIWDLAPHDLSILLYLFGTQPEHLSVQAHAHLQSGIHDTAHLDLGFESGMSAHVHVSWLYPSKRPSRDGDR